MSSTFGRNARELKDEIWQLQTDQAALTQELEGTRKQLRTERANYESMSVANTELEERVSELRQKILGLTKQNRSHERLIDELTETREGLQRANEAQEKQLREVKRAHDEKLREVNEAYEKKLQEVEEAHDIKLREAFGSRGEFLNLTKASHNEEVEKAKKEAAREVAETCDDLRQTGRFFADDQIERLHRYNETLKLRDNDRTLTESAFRLRGQPALGMSSGHTFPWQKRPTGIPSGEFPSPRGFGTDYPGSPQTGFDSSGHGDCHKPLGSYCKGSGTTTPRAQGTPLPAEASEGSFKGKETTLALPTWPTSRLSGRRSKGSVRGSRAPSLSGAGEQSRMVKEPIIAGSSQVDEEAEAQPTYAEQVSARKPGAPQPFDRQAFIAMHEKMSAEAAQKKGSDSPRNARSMADGRKADGTCRDEAADKGDDEVEVAGEKTIPSWLMGSDYESGSTGPISEADPVDLCLKKKRSSQHLIPWTQASKRRRMERGYL
ncbi:MAG: hypothetical protein Q9208_004658 [Pyrenodesmia sp. 3 TL-2023]